MFEAQGLKLESDHLDLSFQNTESWPRVGKNVVAQSLWLSVGDAVSGPGVQLGVSRPEPMTPDRWLGTHYHGSDQFRVLFAGESLLHGKRMAPGQFAYQEAGKPYREGVAGGNAESGESWMFLVHGDRRGARATILRDNGTYELDESDLREVQLDRPVPLADDPYWDEFPGGSKGVAGVSTTLSERRTATISGSFDNAQDWLTLSPGAKACAGLLGHGTTGPLVLSLHGEANNVVVPASNCAAEVVCAVVRGDAKIGLTHYDKGGIRVQRAGAPMDAVVSGPHGVDLVFLITDRRAKLRIDDSDISARTWSDGVEELHATLINRLSARSPTHA